MGRGERGEEVKTEEDRGIGTGTCICVREDKIETERGEADGERERETKKSVEEKDRKELLNVFFSFFFFLSRST